MKITNKFNLPGPLVEAIKHDEYDGKIEHISVTQLIDSPLLRKLRILYHDIAEMDAIDGLWILIGNAVHYILEKSGSKYITEKRTELEIDGEILSGKIDLYDPITKILWDYKVTSVYNWKYNPLGKKEYENQNNVNAYLLSTIGFEVKEIKNLLIFRDWRKYEALTDHNYPEKQCVVIDLPLWTSDEQLAYIKRRISFHKNPDAICTDFERWKDQDKYQIKKPNADRAYRNFPTMQEAKEFHGKMKSSFEYEIKIKKGEYKRCDNYCLYKKFCPLYKEETIF